MTRHRLSVICVMAAALATTSCQSTAALPAEPVTVDVTMRDYGFDYTHAIPRGRIVFHAHNAGRLNHELLLVVLPPGYPPNLDAQLRSSTRRAVPTRARVSPRPPGSDGAFAVDLGAGRYGLISFVRDQDGLTDAVKGMSSEFEVR